MRHMSQYSSDIISETEFKLVMKDLETPFCDIQIHILYLWLDPNRTGRVRYSKLYEALYRALYKRYIIDDDSKEMDLEDQGKWIKMTFKSPTCEPFDLPITFEHLVHLGFTGAMLRELIQLRVPQLASRNLVIFTDPSHYTDTLVHCNQKLYEFSYTGGPKCAPTEANIYYEFSVGYIDCPLLLHVRPKKLRVKPKVISDPQADTGGFPFANQTSSGQWDSTDRYIVLTVTDLMHSLGWGMQFSCSVIKHARRHTCTNTCFKTLFSVTLSELNW